MLTFTGCSSSKSDSGDGKASDTQKGEQEGTGNRAEPKVKKTDGDNPFEAYDTIPNDVLVKFKNNTDKQQRVVIEVTYYKDDEMIDTRSETIDAVEASRTACAVLEKPKDVDRNLIKYDKFEVNIIGETNYLRTSAIDSCEIEYSISDRDVTFEVKNNGDKDITRATGYLIFYKDGIAQGTAIFIRADDYTAGSTTTVPGYTPFGADNNIVEYDDTELILNEVLI